VSGQPETGEPGNARRPRDAIVLIADVVSSRSDFAGSTAALERLARELDHMYADRRLAAFDYTQGDELQGLLQGTADPFMAVLPPALAEPPLRLRWGIARGEVEAGRGPATRRTGPAFLAARAAIREADRRRVGLVARTGRPRIDEILDDLAPLLPMLLEDLSRRQREIGRLILVERLRQADVAARLKVTRATVSVAHGRGRIGGIAGLERVLHRLFDGSLA
jgi:DNA-binding CsgD family transcriptional regulator